MMAGASRWLGGDGESGGDTQQGGQQYRHEDGLQCLAAGGAFEHVGQPENGTSMIPAEEAKTARVLREGGLKHIRDLGRYLIDRSGSVGSDGY